MSNSEINTHIQDLNQIAGGPPAEPVIQTEIDNVFPLPIAGITDADPEDFEVSQGETSDQANVVGIDANEVRSMVEHLDYKDAKDSMNLAISQTETDKIDEKLRAAKYAGNNPDLLAEAKSEKAFDNVEKLKKPAGSIVDQELGQLVLKDEQKGRTEL